MLLCVAKLRGHPEVTHAIGGIYVVWGHKVYVFGGRNARPEEDPDQIIVSFFNSVSLRCTTLPPVTTPRGERPTEVPCNRQFHTAVLIGDTVYIWGGHMYKHELCNNMLYEFEVATHRWLNTEVSGSVPEARFGHSACVLRKDMYVYGGVNRMYDFTNYIYKLDTATMAWALINTRGALPLHTRFHTASIMGTRMFVFGGFREQDGACNTMSVFDTETNCWLSTCSVRLLPKRRFYHSAFVYHGELYIFGGENWSAADGIAYDVWKFSPQTLSWKEVKLNVSDPFRVSCGCCCMVGDRVFIFGGVWIEGPKDDLYVLDFSPSLKTLCKLSVIQYGLDQSELPHNISWELASMTTNV